MNNDEQQQGQPNANAGQPGQAQQQVHVGQTVQYTEKVGDKTRTYAAVVTHVNTDQSASLHVLQPEGGMRTVQNIAYSAQAKDGSFNPLPKQ